MSLHVKARDDQFCCMNGLCTDSSPRCDNLPNCSDGSDKYNCTTLIKPYAYDSTKPPTTKTIRFLSKDPHIYPMDVYVTLIIPNIYDVNELTSTLSIRLDLMVERSDTRISLRDPQDDKMMSSIAVNDTWYPKFETPSNLKSSITYEYNGVFVQKKSNFTRFNGKQELLRFHTFDGSDNTIVMSESHQIEAFVPLNTHHAIHLMKRCAK